MKIVMAAGDTWSIRCIDKDIFLEVDSNHNFNMTSMHGVRVQLTPEILAALKQLSEK